VRNRTVANVDSIDLIHQLAMCAEQQWRKLRGFRQLADLITGEARMAVFEFIEGWYNPHRRHSSIDYQSPINYERRLQTASPKLSTETG